MHGVDPGFERSVDRWLRAYPPRWRAVRRGEVLALLADLAPEDARRLDVRSGLGLLRGGWATRWREHPPPGPYLTYLLAQSRLPARYRAWVRDDIEGRWYVARRGLTGAWLFIGVLIAQVASGSTPDPGLVASGTCLILLITALWGRRWRTIARESQLVLRPHEVVTAESLVPGPTPRERLAARAWLAVAASVVAGFVAIAVAALLLAPSRVAARSCAYGPLCTEVDTAPVQAADRVTALLAAAVGAAVGLLLAWLTARRLPRWQPVEQPHRRVRSLDSTTVLRVTTVLGAVAVLAASAPTAAATLAAPTLAVAGLLLPPLVAAQVVTARGRTRAPAGTDVLRAVLGRADRVDTPAPGYVPATTWLPLGSVVPPPVPVPPPPSAVRWRRPYR